MDYLTVNETDFQKARKKIRENKGKKILFTGSDDELNRKILEKENIDVLLLKMKGRKDKMKQRDSGFNQVLAKIVKKKNIAIGIDLDEILSSTGKEKVEVLARVRQNVEICKKDKVKMVFISQKDKDIYGLKSLGLVLGMPTEMTSSL
jgi:RNase P/RNase MRP subunit p30